MSRAAGFQPPVQVSTLLLAEAKYLQSLGHLSWGSACQPSEQHLQGALALIILPHLRGAAAATTPGAGPCEQFVQ